MKIEDLDSLELGQDERGYVLWHGGRAESGPTKVRRGRAQHGPGLYLTSSRDRAEKYSRGGRRLHKVTIKKNARWLENAILDSRDVVGFIISTPMRNKFRLLKDLVVYGSKNFNLELDPPTGKKLLNSVVDLKEIRASSFLNLCINNGVVVGKTAKKIQEFLVSQGVQASFVDQNHEIWVIVMDDSIILNIEKVTK